ncbi:MAG TPA: universal stress protein [Sunxiuqinia sp.]|nr:universal stress protein [Sunxiuqinia sp.]
MKNQLVTVMKFTKMYAVRFVKEKLEFEGIECFLTDEGFDSTDKKQPMRWNLKVKASDVEPTVKLLLQLNRDFDLNDIHKNHTIRDLRKILVAIDLFNYSFNTIEYAFGMAERIKAEVKFLYVLDDPNLSGPTKYTTSWEKYEKIEKDESNELAQQRMVEFSEQLRKLINKDRLNKAKFHFAVHTGKLGNTLVALSQRYQPDLIIMGQKAREIRNKEHFAKATKFVIEHNQYPVLMIPASSVYSDLEQLNILYVTDFNEVDNTSFNRFIKIIEPFESKIYCAHLDAEDHPAAPERVAEINEFIKEAYPKKDIHVEDGHQKDQPIDLEVLIEKRQIDLISLSTPKRSFIYKLFHPDLVNSMIMASKVPMLIFPIH